MEYIFNYLIIFFILRVNFLAISAEESFECKEIVSKSVLLRLKRHLFCEYDTTVRPIIQSNATINVTIFLMPKFMDFDDHTNIFTLHAWSSFEWLDEHLKWNSEDFDQITDIRVKSSEIWVPDFSVYNSGNTDLLQSGIPSTDCILYNNGTVFCVPAMKYTTQCLGNYAFWPYDKQNCTIRFGSWSHSGEEIDFRFQDEGITTEHFTPHPLWHVERMKFIKRVSKYKCCPNDTFPIIILEINLERQYRMRQSIYVTPAVVLMFITLTVMWLDSRSYERIALSSVNFICHLLVIYDMHWEVPSNGSNVPHMIIFYRNSLLLASFAMILTTLLRKLQTVHKMAPKWIENTVSVVLSYRIAQVLSMHSKTNKILIESSEDNIEDNTEASQTIDKNEIQNWRQLAIIIERISFICVTLAYIIMLIILIPISNDFQSSDFHISNM